MASTKKSAAGTVKTAAAASTPAGKSGGNTGNSTTSAASDFEASGAPAQTSGKIDTSHPAVDADPRAATTDDQNRIDFNDPTLSGQDAVQKNLK